jgi:hypothetical protein
MSSATQHCRVERNAVQCRLWHEPVSEYYPYIRRHNGMLAAASSMQQASRPDAAITSLPACASTPLVHGTPCTISTCDAARWQVHPGCNPPATRPHCSADACASCWRASVVQRVRRFSTWAVGSWTTPAWTLTSASATAGRWAAAGSRPSPPGPLHRQSGWSAAAYRCMGSPRRCWAALQA